MQKKVITLNRLADFTEIPKNTLYTTIELITYIQTQPILQTEPYEDQTKVWIDNKDTTDRIMPYFLIEGKDLSVLERAITTFDFLAFQKEKIFISALLKFIDLNMGTVDTWFSVIKSIQKRSKKLMTRGEKHREFFVYLQ